MAEYIPPKIYIPHTKELLLERIRLEENCISKPFDIGEIYALQKAVLVLDAYETGNLVERKKGKWLELDKDWAKCSECGCKWEWSVVIDCNMEYCPNCGSELEVET